MQKSQPPLTRQFNIPSARACEFTIRRRPRKIRLSDYFVNRKFRAALSPWRHHEFDSLNYYKNSRDKVRKTREGEQKKYRGALKPITIIRTRTHPRDFSAPDAIEAHSRVREREWKFVWPKTNLRLRHGGGENKGERENERMNGQTNERASEGKTFSREIAPKIYAENCSTVKLLTIATEGKRKSERGDEVYRREEIEIGEVEKKNGEFNLPAELFF